MDIAKITSRPCGVISSDPLADCREFTGTRGQWGHPLFSSHTYACTYKGRISWVIYSLAVHTYRYLLFGETFAQMRTVLSVILPVVRFFQKFRPDIILWKGRGKMIFPPNYIARACVRNLESVPAVPTVPAWESRCELPSLNSQFLIFLRINVSSSYERKQARTGSLPERSTPLPG